MGASYYKLDIENRKAVGKKATKSLRSAGKVPSVLYFKGENPMSLSIDKKTLHKAMKSDQRIYEMEINSESQYVMIKEIQYHPVTDEVIHVDFMRVLRSEKMTISVPLVLVGEPIGVNEGGVMSQSLNQIEISCFPTDVPENIELDIEDLELNAARSVADLKIENEDIEIVSDASLNIVSITPPAAEEEPVVEEELDEEGIEGEEGEEGGKDDTGSDEKGESSDDEDEKSGES